MTSDPLRSVVVILLFLFPLTSYPQVNVDSLLHVWNDETKPDTVRLEAMNAIAKEGYLYTDPDSAFYFAQLALELARQVDHRQSMAVALNVQGFSFYLKGEYDKALELYAEGIALYDSLAYSKDLGALYNNTALIHMGRGANAEALENFSRCLKIMESLNNEFGRAVTLNNMGIIYMDQGNHSKAVDHYMQSLKIQEAIGDERVLSNTLVNLGNIYQDQEDYERADAFYRRSLDLAEKNTDELGKANAHNNLGMIARQKNNLEDALKHFETSLEIFGSIGDRQKEAIVLGNIGNIYRDRNQLEEALELYQRSGEVALEIGDARSASAALGNIAHVYRENDQLEKAHEFDLRSLELAKQAEEPRGIRDAAKELYKYYRSAGNPAKALEMHELYIAMRDSIMSEENQREAIRTEFSREAEKRENEIALLNAENQRQEAETRAERNKWLLTMGASSSLILMLIGGGFFIQRNRKQKHQVEITRAELEKKIAETDFLRSQLDPHFIKNALFNMDRLLAEGKTKEAQRYNDRFRKLMNLTLDNAREQLITLDEELDMMEQYLSLEADRLDNRLKWSVNVADDVNPEEVELPPMILQPLVENALKHGADMKSGKGEVKLEVRVENDRVVCTVEDNGIGIGPTQSPLDSPEGEVALGKVSHGLRITRERLEMFSKLNFADARLELLNTGSGTRAVVSFLMMD